MVNCQAMWSMYRNWYSQYSFEQIINIYFNLDCVVFKQINFRKVFKVLINSDGTGTAVDWMPDVPELGRLDSIEIEPGNSQPSM